MGGILSAQESVAYNDGIQSYFCTPCNAHCDTIAFTQAGSCIHCGMTLVKRTKNEQMEILAKQNAQTKKIAVYLHEGIELLDFAGPVEVFTIAGFEVFTVALSQEPITSQGVIKIIPEYTISNCPKPDIIAVFGGNGVTAAKNPDAIKWIKETAPTVELLFSVCTGAFFYANAGLLENKKVTTFHSQIPHLREVVPSAEVLDDVKFVDEGKIITSAGVSSGIEGALYLVSRILDLETALKIAKYIEYDHWSPEVGLVVKQN